MIGYAILRLPDVVRYLHSCSKRPVAMDPSLDSKSDNHERRYAIEQNQDRNYEIEQSNQQLPQNQELT